MHKCQRLPWGIGTYKFLNEEGQPDIGYGFPWPGMNPHDFTPEEDQCTAKEIQCWKDAKEEWSKQ